MKDEQSLEKKDKIIPVLFIIYLGFPITSHSWNIKVEDSEAYINPYECKFAEILHVVKVYYNIDTAWEVNTILLAF